MNWDHCVDYVTLIFLATKQITDVPVFGRIITQKLKMAHSHDESIPKGLKLRRHTIFLYRGLTNRYKHFYRT